MGLAAPAGAARRRRWAAAGVIAALAAAGPVLADPPAAPAGEALVTVMGVVTPYATFGLLKHLRGIPGVESATFDLAHGIADVHLRAGATVTDDQLRAAIRSASYTPGEIRWMSETSENRPGGS
jgi:hypothetical protein